MSPSADHERTRTMLRTLAVELRRAAAVALSTQQPLAANLHDCGRRIEQLANCAVLDDANVELALTTSRLFLRALDGST